MALLILQLLLRVITYTTGTLEGRTRREHRVAGWFKAVVAAVGIVLEREWLQLRYARTRAVCVFDNL